VRLHVQGGLRRRLLARHAGVGVVRAAGAGRTLDVGGWDCGLGVYCWVGCDAKVWLGNRDDVSGRFE